MPAKPMVDKEKGSGPAAISRGLFLFVAIHMLVWILVPALRKSMSPDALEAINWGLSGGWVNDKHPPLSGFLAAFFYGFLGGGIGICILTQLCSLVGFIYIYRLAREFFRDAVRPAMSVILLEGVSYYAFATQQFNVNILSLATWPAAAFYFYRSMHGGKMADWILLGAAIGINVLAKYSCAFLFVGFAAYFALSGKRGWSALETPGPYVCALVAALIVAPHAHAMYVSGFPALEYAAAKDHAAGLLSAAISSLRFAGALALSGLGALLVYFLARRRFGAGRRGMKRDDTLFILAVGAGPAIAMMLTGIAFNLSLKSGWGVPMLYMLSISLLYFFPLKAGVESWRMVTRGMYILMAVMAAANAAVIITSKSERFNMSGPEFAEEIEELWKQGTGGAPLKYVAGDTWYTAIMSIYGAARPTTVMRIDRSYRHVLGRAELDGGGLMLFAPKAGMGKLQRHFGVSAPFRAHEFHLTNRMGERTRHALGYSIVPPRPATGGSHE
ncbi:MAG: glycosyltransferase family 39 protein [Rickettsiales bacterium]|nr:glycosyltransferase family 39 protein [Rickettsiales bacterium]